jgi:hypothetical protein
MVVTLGTLQTKAPNGCVNWSELGHLKILHQADATGQLNAPTIFIPKVKVE